MTWWVRFAVVATSVILADTASSPARAQTEDLAALSAQINQLHAANRNAEALPLAQRALVLAERTHGPDHPLVAGPLDALASILQAQARLSDAEPLRLRSLAIREKALGPGHRDVGSSLNGLARLYRAQGRFADAESLLKRSIALHEQALGLEHHDVSLPLNTLALLYLDMHRTAESEPLFKRSLAIREKTLGPSHQNVATTLLGLATAYRFQGRYAESEPLYQRAFTIYETIGGPQHIDVAHVLNGLAEQYRAQRRYADAEPAYKRALAIFERTLGAAHPNVGAQINNLAQLYLAMGRFAEAIPLFERSLGVTERALGPDHRDVGIALNNMAGLYNLLGRQAEAEQSLKRALAIYEKALAPDHADIAKALGGLAGLHDLQRDWARAVDYWRRSTSVTVRRARRGTDAIGATLSGKARSETELHVSQFHSFVRSAYRLASEQRGLQPGLSRETFTVAQWVQSSEAAASLAQMSARGAKGDAALSRLVRERQDLAAEWRRRDAAHTSAVSQPPDKRSSATEAANTVRMNEIDARISAIDGRLKSESPDYSALSSPEPLTVEEVQAQLHANEALVLFVSALDESFVWVITKTSLRWVRAELGPSGLAREVGALRCGLDATAWYGEAAATCAGLLKMPIGKAPKENEPLPFDMARAHALYQALFGKVADLIAGRHLLLVPSSGPLTQLPFQVLLASPPVSANYKQAAWLARAHTLTVLPAVSSLQALRRVGKPSVAARPLIGFGNPLLDGDQNDPKFGPHYKRLAAQARAHLGCAATREQRTSALRGIRRNLMPMPQRSGLVDLAHVRLQSPLPETADELCAVARDLGADVGDIRLGVRASERELKALSASGQLSQYRILHFATHGMLAGQLSGASEPGLILTPPPQASEEDDGYLSASEIAALKLDADWVILSACNTAAGAGRSGDTSAEALSGLARAFFYAQARALLVSHWEVDSAATVKLITSAVGAIAKDKSVGRAGALRRAMLTLIDAGKPHEAHPAYWAPFVVVGEGGAGR